MALPNADGVEIVAGASGNTIGGGTAAARDVISGNTGAGVELDAPSNAVMGDYIGVNVTGNTGLGNGVGVVIQSGNETIGGPTATPGTAPGNVISANGQFGIYLYNDGSAGNAIQGNLIGLGADGTTALGNVSDGIYVALASLNVTIGGTVAADRNVISDNGGFGILTGIGATGLVIQGNYIGTDITGNLPRANTEYGVYIEAPGALIGGLTATPGTGPGNVISGNGSALLGGTVLLWPTAGGFGRGQRNRNECRRNRRAP